MKRPRAWMALIAVLLVPSLMLVLTGCGASVARAPIPTPKPSPTASPQPGTFYFTTRDGVTLNGQIDGAGKTALIFSNGRGVTMNLWESVAQAMADRGYMSFRYDYRGLGQSQGNDIPHQRENDLRAAIAEAQARGASKIVLIGSSFGGLLSGSVATEAHVAAIVLVSAPLIDSGISLSDEKLRGLAMPKLLIASQNDSSFVSDTQHIYNLSPQPKQIVIYPGKQHGTTIFALEHSADSVQRLTAFLSKYAPASA